MVDWIYSPLKEMARLIAVVTVVGGGVWWLGEPRAQEWVGETVSDDLMTLDDKIKNAEQNVMGELGVLDQRFKELDRKADKAARNSEINATKLENIERLQDETRNDVKSILLGIGSIQRQLP